MKTLNLYSKGFRPKNILNKKNLTLRKDSSPRQIPPHAPFHQKTALPGFGSSASLLRNALRPPFHHGARTLRVRNLYAGCNFFANKFFQPATKFFTQVAISSPTSFFNLLLPFATQNAKKNCVLFPFSQFFCVNYTGAKNAKRIKIHHETL